MAEDVRTAELTAMATEYISITKRTEPLAESCFTLISKSGRKSSTKTKDSLTEPGFTREDRNTKSSPLSSSLADLEFHVLFDGRAFLLGFGRVRMFGQIKPTYLDSTPTRMKLKMPCGDVQEIPMFYFGSPPIHYFLHKMAKILETLTDHQMESGRRKLISLDASKMELGKLKEWKNTGELKTHPYAANKKIQSNLAKSRPVCAINL